MNMESFHHGGTGKREIEIVEQPTTHWINAFAQGMDTVPFDCALTCRDDMPPLPGASDAKISFPVFFLRFNFS